MDSAGVDRAVLVPPAWEGDRNDYALSAAAAHPGRFGVMGRIDLTDSSSRALSEWRSQPGMLGLRLSFARPPDTEWLSDGTADWFWPAAEQAGLPVMVQVPDLLGYASQIADRYPGLRLIIDHFGIRAGLRDAEAAQSVDQLIRLAEHENVAVKASCLPSITSAGYPFTPVRDLVRQVIGAFSVRRVFWGSDLTRLPCTYEEAIMQFTDALGLAEDEIDSIMGGGICEWLGWPLPR
jgi:L-fuconolactonase